MPVQRTQILNELLGSFCADVRIGPGVVLLTALHPVSDHQKRQDGWAGVDPSPLVMLPLCPALAACGAIVNSD